MSWSTLCRLSEFSGDKVIPVGEGDVEPNITVAEAGNLIECYIGGVGPRSTAVIGLTLIILCFVLPHREAEIDPGARSEPPMICQGDSHSRGRYRGRVHFILNFLAFKFRPIHIRVARFAAL